MISLAGRDILHSWGKFVFTGVGLGLLIGVTLTMAGVYRGMVDDAKALLDNSGADLWVVQKDTLGPYAEPSSLPDDVYRSILGMPGVARAANVTYLTMQVRRGDTDVRSMVVGVVPDGPGEPGQPGYLIAGRQITRGHYEAVADVAAKFQLGERIQIRRNLYTVVGLTRRMVSSGGDPMIFIPLKDAQDAQFLKDNDAIVQQRRRTTASPAFNRPGVPGLLDAVLASQSINPSVNAVLVQTLPGYTAEEALETAASVHASADGGSLGPQADRHLGKANCHVSGNPGDRQRGHRRLYHLYPDHGQNPRDRRAQADRHQESHHRRHDHAAGGGARRDRLRGGQDRRHHLGAHLPQIRPARARGHGPRVRRDDGDLCSGQLAGHPRCAQSRPGGGDRRLICTGEASKSKGCANAMVPATPPSMP
jgi:hypothetical protein